jgi:hypothetical protein
MYTRPIRSNMSIASLDIMAIMMVLALQVYLCWQTLQGKRNMRGEGMLLREEVSNLGELLDEALDYIAELGGKIGSTPNPIVQGASESIKETLSSLVMNRLMQQFEHGSKEEPSDRQIQQIEETNISEEV